MYNLDSVPHKPDDEYYEYSDIKDIELIKYQPDDPDFDAEKFDKEHNGNFWPVHSIETPSYVPCKCTDEEDAKDKVLISLNNTVYERINDL